MRLAQRRIDDRDLTTFVSSDHGFAPQFAAIDASKVLVDLGLLSRPQTSQLPPGDRRDDRQGQGLLGRRHGADLPQPGRSRPGRWRVPAGRRPADEAATVAPIEAAFLALADPNDWTGDGAPEGWTVIDRAFTKAEARYIPNGPGSTTDMAHPTRTGDLVVFSAPPYQFDAATPGTLIARSAFFGQHGYVPDVQDLASNTNMRATFLAGGEAIDRGAVEDVRSIDLAPTAAFLLDIPVPQHSQGQVLLDLLRRRRRLHAGQRSSGSTTSTASSTRTTTIVVDASRRGHALRSAAPGSWRTMFDEEAARPPRPDAAAGRRRQRRRLAAELGAARGHPGDRRRERVGPGRHQLRQPRVRLRHRAAPPAPGRGPTSRSCRPTSSRRPPASRRRGCRRRRCSTVNGVEVGVIGADVQNTPELVRADATAGPDVPRRGGAHRDGVREAARARASTSRSS